MDKGFFRKFILEKTVFKQNMFEFFSHSKNYITSGVLSRGIAFVTIPIFTRLLVPNEYGILAIFTALVSILMIFMGAGAKNAILRYYYDKNVKFSVFLSSILSFLFLFHLLTIVFIYLFRGVISNFINLDANLIIIAAFLSSFIAFYKIYLSLLQARKKSKKVAFYEISQKAAIHVIAIILILIIAENKYLGKVYSQFFITFGYFIYIMYQLFSISASYIKIKYVKMLLIFGIPVIFHLLSGYILSFSDRIIIGQLVGNKAAGLYSFAYQIGIIIDICAMGMARSWTPILYEKQDLKKYSFIRNLAKRYVNVIYFLAIALIFFSKEAVIIMASENYHQALPIIPIIIISYVFLFLNKLYIDYIFYYKKTYLLSITSILTAITNIVLNYLLIPKYGYSVAAFTTLISFFLLFVLNYINLKLIIKPVNHIPLRSLLPNAFIVIIIGLLIYFFSINDFFHINYLFRLFVKVSILIILFISFFIKKTNKSETAQ